MSFRIRCRELFLVFLIVLFFIVDSIPTSTIPSNCGKIVFVTLWDGSPVWSPDGKRIAFTSSRDEKESEIYVMDADGGNVRRLTHNPGYDLHPAWSPDGEKIAFEADGDEPVSSDIYVMNADGSKIINLTKGGYNNEPAWCCCGCLPPTTTPPPDNSGICFGTALLVGLLTIAVISRRCR